MRQTAKGPNALKNNMKHSGSPHRQTPIDFEQIKPITILPESGNGGGVTLTGVNAWLYSRYQELCVELCDFFEGFNKAILASQDSAAIQKLTRDYIQAKQYPKFDLSLDGKLESLKRSVEELYSMLEQDERALFFSCNAPFYDKGDALFEPFVVSALAWHAVDGTPEVLFGLDDKKVAKERLRGYVTLGLLHDMITRLKDITTRLEGLSKEFLKKDGRLKAFVKDIRQLPGRTKAVYGTVVHSVCSFCEELCASTLKISKDARDFWERSDMTVDITVPGRLFRMGTLHPITQTIEEMYAIFQGLGFSIRYGPEIETEYYNFDALNIPAGHPARNEQDSFYIRRYKEDAVVRLLRTHTSPVQIHVMKEEKPPLAIITTGRCFRQDAIDATHNPSFYQLEGFQVDRDLSFAHLKGILTVFARRFFGDATQVRFLPDYFPFTTPSAEFAVSCFVCEGKGCSTCGNSGFIEVGGCGLIDPKVFEAVGIDHSYSGYAFGIGVDRLVMTKHKIPDIRILYQNDIRVLKQFF